MTTLLHLLGKALLYMNFPKVVLGIIVLEFPKCASILSIQHFMVSCKKSHDYPCTIYR